MPSPSANWLLVKMDDEERQARLGAALDWSGPLDFSDHRRGRGHYLREACRRTLEDLTRRVQARERATPPFARGDLPRQVHWARPDLVAEVGFTEWTADGRRRHPRFLGLRTDEEPSDVVRERPS